MKHLDKIPKGTIVLFSTGHYSDYNVVGLMKALVDIDPAQIRDEYITLHPEQMLKYSFKQSMFVEYLKEKNLFETVENPNWMEWFLEAYSNISEMKIYEGPILFT